jgi:hypothetical protein
VVVPAEAGTACDDETFCTVDDACDGTGMCIGGPENDCGMTPGACAEVDCVEASQSCTEIPAMNGAPCQDPTNLCLKGSTCNGGSCTGGTIDDCFFFPVSNDCHVATCNPMTGMCEEQIGNEGGPCVDAADLCTVGKTCTAGNCGGGMPKDCSILTVGCFDGVCDMANGNCVQQPIMPGQQCAEATDDCNIGICDTLGNCNATPANQGMACNDNNNCTTGDICQNGVCTPNMTITTCTNNDMCCPSTCNDTNDNDCTYCDWNPALFPIIFGMSYSVGDMTFDQQCNLYMSGDDATVYKFLHNTTNVSQIATFVNTARGIAYRPQDNLIYVATYDSISKMTTSGGNIQTVISGLSPYLNGMAVAPSGWGNFGGHLVVGSSSGQIYLINPAAPTPTVLASTGFSEVSDVVFDKQNKVLYVASYSSSTIHIVSPQGVLSNYLTAPCNPDGIAVDDGQRVFFACGSNNNVWKVNIPTPGTPQLVGNPFLNGSWAPAALIYDGLDNLIVVEEPSNTQLSVFTP